MALQGGAEVAEVGGGEGCQVLDELAGAGSITRTDQPQPRRSGVFGVYLDGQWRELALDPVSIDRDDPIGSLDVALLQERVLAPLLGIGDPRRDPRLQFVGGIRGTEELERRVDSGEAAIAFSMVFASLSSSTSTASVVAPTWNLMLSRATRLVGSETATNRRLPRLNRGSAWWL